VDDFLPYFGYYLDSKKISLLVDVLRDLQETIRKHLVAVASVPAAPSVMGEQEVYLPFTMLGTNISSLTFRFYEGKKWRVAAGTDSDITQCLLTVALALVALHESGKLERLRYCEAPSTEKDKRHCGTLFFAEHGRQQFCSAKCKGREASQRFRYRHKEEVRTKAHARYERKAKAKHGPHVKVGQFRKKKTAKEKG
jgi:predicted RNA-binding Zn ribbon-like protein